MKKREPKRTQGKAKRAGGGPHVAQPPSAVRERCTAHGAGATPFTFRFALEGVESAAVHDDPRIEALRCQLAALLDLVVLTKDGRYVEVDGFKLVDDLPKAAGTVYRIFPAT